VKGVYSLPYLVSYRTLSLLLLKLFMQLNQDYLWMN